MNCHEIPQEYNLYLIKNFIKKTCIISEIINYLFSFLFYILITQSKDTKGNFILIYTIKEYSS